MRHPESTAVLSGTHVTLLPLEQSHIDTLLQLAENERIWTYFAVDGSNLHFLRNNLEQAIEERLSGKQIPFIITLKDGQIIGSTRLFDIQAEHKKLEIGWTWLHPDFWGKGFNTESKLLLLTYCFEELQMKRVQFRTDVRNQRSRAAIEKTGATQEGIFRNDMIRSDNSSRDSVYFSIIDSEWPTVKSRLNGLLTSD